MTRKRSPARESVHRAQWETGNQRGRTAAADRSVQGAGRVRIAGPDHPIHRDGLRMTAVRH